TDLVALDTETTGLDARADRARLLSLALDTSDGGTFSYLVDCFAVDPAPILEALAGKALVAHNAAFDLGFLARLGFTPAGAVHDTMLYSRLVYAGQDRTLKHTLAACVGRELGQALDKTAQVSDWSGPLLPGQLDYAARDVEVLRPLLDVLTKKIEAA